MIEKYLKDLTDEELQELFLDKRSCMCEVYRTCVQLGNKDPENNVIVKGYFEQLESIKKELKERGL